MQLARARAARRGGTPDYGRAVIALAEAGGYDTDTTEAAAAYCEGLERDPAGVARRIREHTGETARPTTAPDRRRP